MKKQAKILTIINAAVILLLLIISAIMFFMVGSSSKNIFGQQVKLVVGETLDDEIGEACLVFVKPKDASELAVGGYFIYTSNEMEFIAKADSVENNIISYTDTAGETATISAASEEYGGKITSKSNFWGEIFASIAGEENISLSFIFIGGIFIISMLSLVIIYVVNTRSQVRGSLDEENNTEELLKAEVTIDEESLILETGAEISAPLPPAALLSDEVTQNSDVVISIDEEELLFPQPVINVTEFKDFDKVDFEEIMSEIADYEKLFDKPQRQTAEPIYQLTEENVPSIDSLLARIDEQFEVTEFDNTKH